MGGRRLGIVFECVEAEHPFIATLVSLPKWDHLCWCISVSDDFMTAASISLQEIAAAEAVTLRRLERMKEIADLITREKSLIMELSNELTELHSSAKATAAGKSAKCSSASGTSVSVNEANVVDLNLRFLLAREFRMWSISEIIVNCRSEIRPQVLLVLRIFLERRYVGI